MRQSKLAIVLLLLADRGAVGYRSGIAVRTSRHALTVAPRAACLTCVSSVPPSDLAAERARDRAAGQDALAGLRLAAAGSAAVVALGLGRIAALYDRSSTSYQIH